jgi:hypothetical protein
MDSQALMLSMLSMLASSETNLRARERKRPGVGEPESLRA